MSNRQALINHFLGASNDSLENDLKKLSKEISIFDSVDLLASVAALQIMPENAERAIRLEALAHVVASIPNKEKKPSISIKQLRKLCNSYPIGEGYIAQQEDPFESIFTEAFTFYGGSYVVFPGSVAEMPYILRQLARALFHHNKPITDHQFLEDARGLIKSVLVISNEIAHRAGLYRGVEPHINQGNDVLIPPSAKFGRLKKAVTFSKTELDEILKYQRIQSSIINDISTDLGDSSLDDYLSEKGKLFSRPIVKINDQFIIAIPCMLLTAAVNWVIKTATNKNLKEELAAKFQHSIWVNVIQSLDYLKNEPVEIRTPAKSIDIPLMDHGFFRLDTDKLTYALVISDSLDEYDGDDPFGTQPLDDLDDKIYLHLKQIEKYIFELSDPPNDVLFLVIVQGVGRFSAFGLDRLLEFKPNILIMSAADLETISLLEGGEPLTLWKYAKASWKARNLMNIHSWGDLNEFGFYRERECSYYLSDEAKPKSLYLVTDFIGSLKREVIQKIDPHGVPAHIKGYTTEVIALHGTKNIPIYVPLGSIGKQVAVLVKGLPFPIWIIGPKYDNEEQWSLHTIYAQIADTISYWLWQFSSSLNDVFKSYESSNQILIELEIIPNEAWHLAKTVERIPPGNPIDISLQRSVGKIKVIFYPQMIKLLMGPDNHGECVIMRQILSGLRDLLLSEEEKESLSSSNIDLIIKQFASPGIKKMMILLDTNQKPELDPRKLPPFRKIQKADESDILDELGDYLRSKGYSVGPIPDDKKTKLLNNEVIVFLQKEFESLISQLDSKGLLEWLVTNHESIIKEQSLRQLTVPTRLACFSSEQEMVKKLSKEIPEFSIAAIANRYIIEYVVARPPSGLRPISLSVYDKLMVLASLIFDFGLKSDLIYYRLADIKLSILPSERLGQNLDSYIKAQTNYLNRFVGEGIDSSIKSFDYHFKIDKKIEKPEVVEELDTAADKEFGFSFTDLKTFILTMISLADEVDPTTPKIKIVDLYDRLERESQWPVGKIKNIIDRLSLLHRSDFFNPPAPYKGYDVWPWRFNRELSYIRRPLLQVTSINGIEIIWGPRFLYKMGAFLIELCMSGRLKAKSLEMRQLIGKLKHEEGEAFNDLVADYLESKEYLIIKRRLKKIGRASLASLGDIDVLVVDTRNKTVALIECKNYEAARTSFEMGQELEKLFKGKKKDKSDIEKLKARQEFVQQHISELCEWLKLKPAKRYKVKSLVVSDQELFTPYVYDSPIEVISFRQLKNVLEKGRL